MFPMGDGVRRVVAVGARGVDVCWALKVDLCLFVEFFSRNLRLCHN